jgi:hypothetical protein
MNIIEEAKLIYMAQPTAYNARALQIAVMLEKISDKIKWNPAKSMPVLFFDGYDHTRVEHSQLEGMK